MYLKKSLVKRQKSTNRLAVPIQNTETKDVFSISLANASRLLIVVQTWDIRRGVKFGVFL